MTEPQAAVRACIENVVRLDPDEVTRWEGIGTGRDYQLAQLMDISAWR